jgi:hypothetical protein
MAKTAERLGIKAEKKPPQPVVLSEFELQNELWPPADAKVFSNAYRPRLRRAGKAAELPWKKIDSRTLRRTCAREMILAQGFEAAAAVLRDSIETLRAHYADLLPSDVTTER